MARKSIGWIEVHLKRYGAIVYNEEARRALARDFDVELVDATAKTFQKFRYLRLPEALMRLLFLKGEKDIWIRDFYSVLTMPFDRTRGKQVAIMHHLDFSGFPLVGRVPLSLLKKLFYRNLKKVDAIVVVSEYWKKHFEDRGYKNVHIIYNGFELPEIGNVETPNKPIVYIGNCQKPKGVLESYSALKDLPVELVTSGHEEVKLPATHLELEYTDYLRLLKKAAVVVTMSKFQEGWNRTAHEAMCMGTPVVGSGQGGMRELLEQGGQIVCEDFADLKAHVENLLTNPLLRESMGGTGYKFAQTFTRKKFEQSWISFLSS